MHAPCGAAKRDPLDSGFAAAGSSAQVVPRRAVTQILDAIVPAFIVEMIDVSARMLAINVEPSQPMGKENAVIDRNCAISVAMVGPGLEPCGGCPARDAPVEAAGSGRVIEQFSQPLRGQFRFHAIYPPIHAPDHSGLRSPSASGAGCEDVLDRAPAEIGADNDLAQCRRAPVTIRTGDGLATFFVASALPS
jgi:hypothetical protein